MLASGSQRSLGPEDRDQGSITGPGDMVWGLGLAPEQEAVLGRESFQHPERGLAPDCNHRRARVRNRGKARVGPERAAEG